MSDSLRPHGLWPARLFCPWDSPGKNIGAGCHFLLQGGDLFDPGIKPGSPALQADSLLSEPPGKPCCCCCCYVTLVVSDSVRPHRQQPTRLPRPWDSPGKNTGVGCHLLLQCMKVKSESEVAQSCPTLSDSLDCSPPGSSVHGIFQARVLEWGAIAFSRGSSQRWDQTQVSCIPGRCFNP